MAGPARPGEDADGDDDAREIAAVTHELLGSLAVVRGVARMLLQDPNLSAGERRTLLTVLDRQVDLMQATLACVALGEDGGSAGPLALDDISGP